MSDSQELVLFRGERRSSHRPAKRPHLAGCEGIGLATVARLAREGSRVVGLDRQAEGLTHAMAGLRDQGLDVAAAICDVCDRGAVTAVLEAEPRVDVMVCAAGIYNDAPLLELTEQAFRQMLEVNVTIGTFIAAQEAARRMQAGGRIVTISSRGALGALDLPAT